MRDEDEGWGPDGYPMFAAVLGGLAVAAIGYFGLPIIGAMHPVRALATGAAAAACVWAVAWLITLRHVSGLMKWAVFIFLCGTGMGAAHLGNLVAGQQIRSDLRTLMEMELDRDGFPRFPARAEARGPISKLYVAFVREIGEGQRALDAEAERAGIRLLADAAALRANPKILSDCTRIAGVKQAAHDMIERRRARFKALAAALQATDYPAAFKRGFVEGMTGDDSDADLTELESIQGRILDATQGACTVLARRRWVPQGPIFIFSNEADLEAFSAFGQRQNEGAARLQRLQAASRARLRESQRAMREAMDTLR